ncbi:MAG: DUF423 domain-containing protein [Gammaproteobacteria bacterium]|nr:DUF423 domain-containing protein [Gammaproteobacteria bacterium]
MSKLDQRFILIGALSLMVTIMMSAYGFHGLGDSIPESDRLSWRWAVQIQAWHSLALILIALIKQFIRPAQLLNLASGLFVIGTLIFSGSIYAEKMGAPAVLGEIAPYGGTTLMIAWLTVALALLLNKSR